MSAGPPIWLLPVVYAFHLYDKWMPKRCAVPGKTRVHYSFKKLAGKLHHERDESDPFEPGIGVVVDRAYDYVVPGNREAPSGTYTHNTKFPGGYIVRPDDGGPLVYVPQESARFTSEYERAVPGFYAKNGTRGFRVGPLPDIKAYPEDLVRLTTDEKNIERKVGDVRFTPAGEPLYKVCMTPREIKDLNTRRRLAADARGRSWEVAEEGETHSWVGPDLLELVRRGNIYHLESGSPEQLKFPNLEEEVRFFSQKAGIWLADELGRGRIERCTRQEAIDGIEAGEFDLAVPMFDDEFTPICIMERYAQFYDRARNAGLEYLRSL